MPDTFVSEPIEPAPGSFAAPAAAGEPALPMRFAWRGRDYVVQEVIEQWKESGPERGGGREIYLRKHWYHVRTDDGSEMKIYFERQARSKGAARKRWWLYTVTRPEADPGA